MAWFTFRTSDGPTPRECHSFTAVGSSVFLFGGNDHNTRFDDLLVLNARECGVELRGVL